MQPLQLPEATEEQHMALDTLYKTTREVRLRTRAQMVLLAIEQKLTAPAIAAIVREDDQTVRRWLKRWMAEGIEGLKDRPMPGPPPKILEAYKEQLLATVRRRPRSLDQPYSMWTQRAPLGLHGRANRYPGLLRERSAPSESRRHCALAAPAHRQ